MFTLLCELVFVNIYNNGCEQRGIVLCVTNPYKNQLHPKWFFFMDFGLLLGSIDGLILAHSICFMLKST